MCLVPTCARIHTSTYWTSVFEGVAELGKLSFALAYAGDAEYMWLPDNRNALDAGDQWVEIDSKRL